MVFLKDLVLQVFLTATHLGIVMEYAAGGELFDRIVKAGRFSEDEARFFFQQLLSGVAYCHSEVQHCALWTSLCIPRVDRLRSWHMEYAYAPMCNVVAGKGKHQKLSRCIPCLIASIELVWASTGQLGIYPTSSFFKAFVHTVAETVSSVCDTGSLP